MSASIIILKEIDKCSYTKVLESIRKSASDSSLYSIYENIYIDEKGEFKDFDGTLSEVDEETFKANHEKGIYTKNCTFNIYSPTEESEDSFTWLINKKNYFRAFDLENLDNEYEFALQFLKEYFKNNTDDYLWFDDADWYYSAKDLIWLGNQPYNPMWTSRKLSQQNMVWRD